MTTALKKPTETPAHEWRLTELGEPVTNVILKDRNGLISGDSAQSLRVGGNIHVIDAAGRITAMYQGPELVRIVFQSGANIHTAFVPNDSVSLSAYIQTTPVGPVAA